MPLFVLSPASLAHSALFAGYYSYLASNVFSLRLKTGWYLGNGHQGADAVRWKEAKGQPNPQDEAQLTRAIRAHANFAESTPFAFFLLFLAELNGAPTSLIHGGFLSLFVGRVLHGSFGIMDDTTAAIGRPIGFILTYGITVASGLYNLNLGYEPLKSFLGFK